VSELDPIVPSPVEPVRRRDWNAAAAVIASFIGLLALLVSGYTASLQRQQVRAQVWPYLETGISPSQRVVTLVNKGIGPASIRSVEIYVDGSVRTSWPQVFDALGLSRLRMTPTSTINGVVVSASERVQQVGFTEAADFEAFYREYPRIDQRICYCSALDECWVLDERVSGTEARTSVDVCSIDAAKEFIDNKILEPAAVAPARSHQEPT
jgi:hypothetical protein